MLTATTTTRMHRQQRRGLVSLALQSLLLCIILPSFSNAEIRPFHGWLEAASFFVHFTFGYLNLPGSVDLTNLKFTLPIPIPILPHAGGGIQSSVVDLVLFREPDSCAHSKKGCDWTALGIGFKDIFGDVLWCCTDSAVKAGVCTDEQVNRLIIHPSSKDFIDHHVLDVPNNSSTKTLQLRDPVFKLSKHSAGTGTGDKLHLENGKFVLIMANCNNNGQTVAVDGTYAFKSAHGYLPGDLFGEYHFFFFVFSAYILLAAWYGWLYKQHEPSRIPIQTWILATMGLGCLEAFLRCLDYVIWNSVGTRHPLVLYTAIMTGALKHTVARCLLVMVSLGWGVTCNALGRRNFIRLIVLAIFYAILAIATDIVAIVAFQDMASQKMGARSTELKLLSVDAVLGLLVVGINVLFLIWIFTGTARTMSHLTNTHQDAKLERYRHLRLLLIFFATYAIVWFILMRAEVLYRWLPNSQAWIVQTLMELDYFLLIMGVAVLWMPTVNARDYAFEMQLAHGDDEHELELTEEVVPSSVYDDDDDETKFTVLPNGVQA